MTEVTPPANNLLAEQTDAQRGVILGDAMLWANGGCFANPMGFPAYGSPYTRSYWTYRWQLQCEVLRFVRHISTSPILSSYWQYKAADDSVPQARVDRISKRYDALRQQAMKDILRGRDFGWAGFEPIWDVAGGEYRLQELKPLAWDMTQVMTDKKGRFTGLRQGDLSSALTAPDETGMQQGALPAPFKAWVYSYDRECGNIFGRSWLENCRQTSWKDWLDCQQQLQKIAAKIAGTQAIVKSPESHKEASINAIKALSNGAPGMWVPNMVDRIDPKGNPELVKLLGDLAKSSWITVDVLDFGSTAPAIANILDRMKHDEELMFMAGLRPPRSGMEGTHGTKAEAGVHTDTAVLASEVDDDDIAAQFQKVIDADLYLNDGPEAVGSVLLDTPPLVDTKAQRNADFLKALATDKGVAQGIAKIANMPELLDTIEFPVTKGAVFEISEPTPPPAATNGATNGNIKPIGKRTMKVANRLLNGN